MSTTHHQQQQQQQQHLNNLLFACLKHLNIDPDNPEIQDKLFNAFRRMRLVSEQSATGAPQCPTGTEDARHNNVQERTEAAFGVTGSDGSHFLEIPISAPGHERDIMALLTQLFELSVKRKEWDSLDEVHLEFSPRLPSKNNKYPTTEHQDSANHKMHQDSSRQQQQQPQKQQSNAASSYPRSPTMPVPASSKTRAQTTTTTSSMPTTFAQNGYYCKLCSSFHFDDAVHKGETGTSKDDKRNLNPPKTSKAKDVANSTKSPSQSTQPSPVMDQIRLAAAAKSPPNATSPKFTAPIPMPPSASLSIPAIQTSTSQKANEDIKCNNNPPKMHRNEKEENLPSDAHLGIHAPNHASIKANADTPTSNTNKSEHRDEAVPSDPTLPKGATPQKSPLTPVGDVRQPSSTLPPSHQLSGCAAEKIYVQTSQSDHNRAGETNLDPKLNSNACGTGIPNARFFNFTYPPAPNSHSQRRPALLNRVLRAGRRRVVRNANAKERERVARADKDGSFDNDGGMHECEASLSGCECGCNDHADISDNSTRRSHDDEKSSCDGHTCVTSPREVYSDSMGDDLDERLANSYLYKNEDDLQDDGHDGFLGRLREMREECEANYPCHNPDHYDDSDLVLESHMIPHQYDSEGKLGKGCPGSEHCNHNPLHRNPKSVPHDSGETDPERHHRQSEMRERVKNEIRARMLATRHHYMQQCELRRQLEERREEDRNQSDDLSYGHTDDIVCDSGDDEEVDWDENYSPCMNYGGCIHAHEEYEGELVDHGCIQGKSIEHCCEFAFLENDELEYPDEDGNEMEGAGENDDDGEGFDEDGCDGHEYYSPELEELLLRKFQYLEDCDRVEQEKMQLERIQQIRLQRWFIKETKRKERERKTEERELQEFLRLRTQQEENERNCREKAAARKREKAKEGVRKRKIAEADQRSRSQLFEFVLSGNLCGLESLLALKPQSKATGANVEHVSDGGKLHPPMTSTALLLEGWEYLVNVEGGGVVSEEGRGRQESLLHCAVRSGDPRMVEKVIEKGAPLDAIDNQGLLPLHLACSLSSPRETVACLLAAAPHLTDVPAVNTGRTPLHYAAEAGDEEAVECLLAANARLNIVDLDGNTPESLAKAGLRCADEDVNKSRKKKGKKGKKSNGKSSNHTNAVFDEAENGNENGGKPSRPTKLAYRLVLGHIGRTADILREEKLRKDAKMSEQRRMEEEIALLEQEKDLAAKRKQEERLLAEVRKREIEEREIERLMKGGSAAGTSGTSFGGESESIGDTNKKRNRKKNKRGGNAVSLSSSAVGSQVDERKNDRKPIGDLPRMNGRDIVPSATAKTFSYSKAKEDCLVRSTALPNEPVRDHADATKNHSAFTPWIHSPVPTRNKASQPSIPSFPTSHNTFNASAFPYTNMARNHHSSYDIPLPAPIHPPGQQESPHPVHMQGYYHAFDVTSHPGFGHLPPRASVAVQMPHNGRSQPYAQRRPPGLVGPMQNGFSIPHMAERPTSGFPTSPARTDIGSTNQVKRSVDEPREADGKTNHNDTSFIDAFAPVPTPTQSSPTPITSLSSRQGPFRQPAISKEPSTHPALETGAHSHNQPSYPASRPADLSQSALPSTGISHAYPARHFPTQFQHHGQQFPPQEYNPLSKLIEMGYRLQDSKAALATTNGNLKEAVDVLLRVQGRIGRMAQSGYGRGGRRSKKDGNGFEVHSADRKEGQGKRRDRDGTDGTRKEARNLGRRRTPATRSSTATLPPSTSTATIVTLPLPPSSTKSTGNSGTGIAEATVESSSGANSSNASSTGRRGRDPGHASEEPKLGPIVKPPRKEHPLPDIRNILPVLKKSKQPGRGHEQKVGQTHDNNSRRLGSSAQLNSAIATSSATSSVVSLAVSSPADPRSSHPTPTDVHERKNPRGHNQDVAVSSNLSSPSLISSGEKGQLEARTPRQQDTDRMNARSMLDMMGMMRMSPERYPQPVYHPMSAPQERTFSEPHFPPPGSIHHDRRSVAPSILHDPSVYLNTSSPHLHGTSQSPASVSSDPPGSFSQNSPSMDYTDHGMDSMMEDVKGVLAGMGFDDDDDNEFEQSANDPKQPAKTRPLLRSPVILPPSTIGKLPIKTVKETPRSAFGSPDGIRGETSQETRLSSPGATQRGYSSIVSPESVTSSTPSTLPQSLFSGSLLWSGGPYATGSVGGVVSSGVNPARETEPSSQGRMDGETLRSPWFGTDGGVWKTCAAGALPGASYHPTGFSSVGTPTTTIASGGDPWQNEAFPTDARAKSAVHFGGNWPWLGGGKEW